MAKKSIDPIIKGISKGVIKPTQNVQASLFPMDEDDKELLANEDAKKKSISGLKVETMMDAPPVEIPQDAPIVNTNEGVKTVGQDITSRMVSNASTPEEAVLAVEVGQEAQKDAQANSDVIKYQKGLELKNAIGFDRYAERKPEMSKSNLPVDVFMYNADDKQRMMAEAKQRMLQNQRNASAPVYEKMGLEEYYPDIHKDIGVGSISSQMLGSRTRYVPQGGLIPWGMVDARRRALDADAMKKAEIANDIKSKRFVTSSQYQQTYDDYFIDKQNDYLDMAGGDASLLMDPSTELGREYQKFMTQMENAYKENLEVDASIDNIMAMHEKGDYVPIDMLNAIDDWSTGRMNVDQYIQGGRKISELKDQIKSYESKRVYYDDKLKAIEDQKDVLPLKPTVDFSNPTVAKNAADALDRTKFRDYDSWLSAIKTYYNTDKLESIIDGAYGMSSRFYKGKSEDELNAMKMQDLEYMVGSLGDEIKVDQKMQGTNDLGWYNADLARKKFAYEKEQDKTFYANNNENTINLAQTVQDIKKNPNLTEQQKVTAIRKTYAQNANYDQEATDRFGFSVNGIPLSNNELQKPMRTNGGNAVCHYRGKSYDARGLEQKRNELRRQYYAKGKPTPAEHKELSNLNATIDIMNRNEVEYTPEKRYSTGYNTYRDGDRIGINPGEYIDPNQPAQTLLIDETNNISYYEQVEDKKTHEFFMERRNIKSPLPLQFYNNGSDENVIGEFDATDKELAKQTNLREK